MNQKRSIWLRPLALGLAVLAVAGTVFGFVRGVQNASDSHRHAAAANLEQALRRGAAACYATEGAYPPSAAYLIQHYGIAVDTERYAVFYEIFAENLMPEITVVER
ncbi:MAG: hypothetical protein IKD06_01520 [Clostridia bacterium]|nr:hypothetical protein [Clostridia bacterium]